MGKHAAPAHNLEGQVAVITGAGGVIGGAISRAFAKAGARVVLGDVRFAAADQLASSLDSRIAAAIECDVTDREQVGELIRTAMNRFGRLDILVNVAGVAHVEDVLTVSVEAWRSVFSVNLEGSLLAAQSAAGAMLEQEIDPQTARRGTIVSIGSQAAEFPGPTSAAYGASKAALNHLSRSLANALADKAICSSVVYPGMVYDGMWKQIVSQRALVLGQRFEDMVQADLAETPSGQFQDPADLAKIVLYMASVPGMSLNGKIVWSEAHQE